LHIDSEIEPKLPDDKPKIDKEESKETEATEENKLKLVRLDS
jgi:hypothetical protein